MPNGRSFAKPLRPFNEPTAPLPQHAAFIPPWMTNLVNLNLPLDIILPGVDQEIDATGKLVFHAAGDTGGIKGTEVQEWIADAMQSQIAGAHAAKTPAELPRFFYNLGDVVYYNGMTRHYREQFYEPYQNYEAPIFAIAGNHDGDNRTRPGNEPDDEQSLTGFQTNFCSAHAVHLFKHRETMTQPYVHWTLETPLANIIGLYSNVDGSLDARGTFEQQRWLEQQLAAAPKDRAVIITVHHPAYSLDTSHGGYGAIDQALDRAYRQSGRVADLVLSGHVHCYQRFTRRVGKQDVPYVIAGAGGYANRPQSLHTLAKDPATGAKISATPKNPFPTTRADVALAAYVDRLPGFLRIGVTKKEITGEYHTVDFEGKPQGVADSFRVDLARHTVK